VFSAVATDGTVLDERVLIDDRMLFGFFSVDCGTCWTRLPQFAEYARASGLPADRVVGVVIGDARAAGRKTSELARIGHVVVEPQGGPVAEAFNIRLYPSFVTTAPGGRVEQFAFSVAELPTPVGHA
jgi:hypothetical protein